MVGSSAGGRGERRPPCPRSCLLLVHSSKLPQLLLSLLSPLCPSLGRISLDAGPSVSCHMLTLSRVDMVLIVDVPRLVLVQDVAACLRAIAGYSFCILFSVVPHGRRPRTARRSPYLGVLVLGFLSCLDVSGAVRYLLRSFIWCSGVVDGGRGPTGSRPSRRSRRSCFVRVRSR